MEVDDLVRSANNPWNKRPNLIIKKTMCHVRCEHQFFLEPRCNKMRIRIQPLGLCKKPSWQCSSNFQLIDNDEEMKW